MRIGSALMLSLGVGLIVAAFAWGAYGVWFRAQADEVKATVIELRLSSSSDGDTYCPVIRYTTRNGQRFTHESNVCSWPAAYDEGEEITLWYERGDPEHIQLDGFISKWLASIILAFNGVIFAGIGAATFMQEHSISVADIFKRQG